MYLSCEQSRSLWQVPYDVYRYTALIELVVSECAVECSDELDILKSNIRVPSEAVGESSSSANRRNISAVGGLPKKAKSPTRLYFEPQRPCFLA